MAIAETLQNFLTERGVKYDVVPHPRSLSSALTAAAAHVPGDRLAKAVLIEGEAGYLMAVVPSTHHVDLHRMHRQLGPLVRLATEDEVAQIFKDCKRGAIPPVGFLYGIETLLDESLAAQPEVWFEAGDHEELIHVSRDEFGRIHDDIRRVQFSHHV